MNLNPFIRPKSSNVRTVMLDVVYALIPLIIIAGIAFGKSGLFVIGISIGSAVLTDLFYSAVFLKDYKKAMDGSAIITGLLLAFTVSPLTPIYVIAFGASMAILFGKGLWGGLGKNRFNPALVGREFMSVFFASTMTSPEIWQTKTAVWIPATDVIHGLKFQFLDTYTDNLLYKTSGALGEYSIALITLAGIFLLFRKRISWHIPFGLLVTFSVIGWLASDQDVQFSMAGMLFAAIFMATDMPSSPSTPVGKLYYGAMIGVVSLILIIGNVKYEYLSYSILILNGFSYMISDTFRPQTWGADRNIRSFIERCLLLTLAIIGTTMAVLSLYYYQLISYLIYIYLFYCLVKFNPATAKSTQNSF